jgi:ATP-dependent 26S proteasome regulatory subunit
MDGTIVAELLKEISTGASLFYCVVINERRMEAAVGRAAARFRDVGTPLVWTCADGFVREGVQVPETVDPLKAIDFALAPSSGKFFIFKDLPRLWADRPEVLRRLKDLGSGALGQAKIFFIFSEADELPTLLREDVVLLRQQLPTVEEIREHLVQICQRDPLLKQLCEKETDLPERLTLAARGLDLTQLDRAVRVLRTMKVPSGESAVSYLLESKRKIIRASGIMEYVDNDLKGDHVGGMENLKRWMSRRESVFGMEAISSGASLPKGILIMGIAGCGKSLFVKAIAGQWRLPLVRLDMASVYSGIHGSPESGLQRAFRTAEAIAPCVLWIDEIEAGISSQGFKSEGGVASRILGLFLTWMQEKRSPVFVAATANAIEMLPAEVLRKGRFDEIFYVGLPDAASREEIFRIHISRQQAPLSSFDLPLLAGSTRGFSGSEIEQAVVSGAFEALADRRPMTQQDIIAAVSRTVPLSVTMAEQIKKIEAWAFKRAVPASGKFT